MSESGLLYSNGRIKTMENSLLSAMQLSRLTDAQNMDEAVKILHECGYGGGMAAEGDVLYERLIDFEREKAVLFLKENFFKGSGLETLLTKQDYHNAKAVVKAKYLDINEVGFMLYPDGNLQAQAIKQAAESGEYGGLPRFMAEAIEQIDKAFEEGNRNPRLIDNLLDKAAYRDIFFALKKIRHKILTDYFTASADLINLSSYIRVNKLGLGFGFLSDCFIGGGTLSEGFFRGLPGQSDEQFKDKVKYTPYAKIIIAAFESDKPSVRFEALADDYLLDIFRRQRHDMLSVAPIAGFYLARITELRVVGMIMSSIKNNIDAKLLKQRLRELYA